MDNNNNQANTQTQQTTDGQATVQDSTQQTTAAQTTAAGIDYDKLARVVEGRQQAAGATALKNYLKEQGLSGEELSAAIKDFKQKKAASEPDVGAMQTEISGLKAALTQSKLDTAIMSAGLEIGLDTKAINHISGLVVKDPTEVVNDDGSINADKVKEAFNQLLEDIPQLKPSVAEPAEGFKIGSDGNAGASQQVTEQDRLRKIMGLK